MYQVHRLATEALPSSLTGLAGRAPFSHVCVQDKCVRHTSLRMFPDVKMVVVLFNNSVFVYLYG
jgi:hypothetical protein